MAPQGEACSTAGAGAANMNSVSHTSPMQRP